ncbi:hypothetical protein [uncultured Senegalimassilia sp.]|uniref:hypothetical protein n=1 Tax=uncultured Senegalimassilia sp. TaxID=1714350 RepID=UPI00267662C0|nr:hypothetical protein [uncultured Senegalimassilia sp.]
MAKVVYNIAAVFSSILNLLVFGWLDYFSIFKTYFDTFDIVGKIGAVILFALLIAVPVLIVPICVHRWRVNHQLKHDDTSNKAPYREIGRLNKQVLELVPTAWDGDPRALHDGKITVPDSLWFVGTANNDDSTFTITDKVYDRAIPIELNERADAFECPRHERVHVTSQHLQYLFQKAKVEHVISEDVLEKMHKLDQYLQTRFRLAFGNRIIKQMYDFIPVYVACGGTELGGMDYIIARKVLKKFESMNVSFVRDEMTGLIEYIEKTFGEGGPPDSVSYLLRIQNMY